MYSHSTLRDSGSAAGARGLLSDRTRLPDVLLLTILSAPDCQMYRCLRYFLHLTARFAVIYNIVCTRLPDLMLLQHFLHLTHIVIAIYIHLCTRISDLL